MSEKLEHDVDIYFVGGTSSTWTGLTEQVIENLTEWLDDKEDAKTFKVNFINHDKAVYVRKELILFINII